MDDTEIVGVVRADIKPEDGAKVKDTADERGRSEGVLNEVGCSGKLMSIFVEKILETHSGEAGSSDDKVRGKLKVAEKEGSVGQRGGNDEEDGSGTDGEGRNASDEDWKDDVAREDEGKIDTGAVTMGVMSGVVEEEN